MTTTYEPHAANDDGAILPADTDLYFVALRGLEDNLPDDIAIFPLHWVEDVHLENSFMTFESRAAAEAWRQDEDDATIHHADLYTPNCCNRHIEDVFVIANRLYTFFDDGILNHNAVEAFDAWEA